MVPQITPPPPPRLLTVCLGQEPVSLFIYSDSSQAARSVRQALYDGPEDVRGYEVQPVILEPDSLKGLQEPVTVVSNTLVTAADGKLVNLGEGVSFLPAGCMEPGCAQIYSFSSAEASMDQLVVRFKLRPGISWSDGTPVTASDSVYSYEVAKALYPRVRPELLEKTESYQALDELTIEWRGVPGYKDPLYATNFFAPLPRHAWGTLATQALLSDESANRTPLGWGPYVIEEWTAGDHITLKKNPYYFRSSEGLPHYDQLVFRFIGQNEAGLDALLAGECDFLDETALVSVPKERLLQLQDEGRIRVSVEQSMAWEHADFNLAPIDPAQINIFQVKELRQAIAMCINRQELVDTLFYGKAGISNSYVPPAHPLYNAESRAYAYDPQAAGDLFNAAGWLDSDGNPQTPRIASGVAGVPDGTPLAFNYQTLGGGERQLAAQMIRDDLVECGVQVNLEFTERDALFAAGPDGPVFGRRYAMTQYAWPASLQPACFLYISSEIPGPAPQFPKGWGGANAAGYNNPAFDQACLAGQQSLPDLPTYADAHRQAQAIFAEDLPVIPLYIHITWAAMRADLCGVEMQPAVENALWNLEVWDDGCTP